MIEKEKYKNKMVMKNEKTELRKRNTKIRDGISESERLKRECMLLRFLEDGRKDKKIDKNKKKDGSLIEQVIAIEDEAFLEFNKSSAIYLYSSFRSEFPTENLIKKSISDGKKVLLPRIENEIQMNFYQITDISQLKKGYMGILEPDSDCEPYLEDGFMFLPGLAFDENGGRLGYGGGFYDRFLKRAEALNIRIYKVGLCFREQMVEKVPRFEYDILLDTVLKF